MILFLPLDSGDVGNLGFFCFGFCFSVCFVFHILSVCLSAVFESRTCFNTTKINASVHITLAGLCA